MTKTEQLVLDRVRSANDTGRGAWDVVGHCKGVRGRWGYSKGPEKRSERAALDRLLASGLVIQRGRDYYAAGHPALASAAAEVSLPRLARRVAECRAELDRAEAKYAAEQAFVREHS